MNKAHEKISVALCTFNGARYIGQQLASLAAQSLPPDELVVNDDCSTDNTIAEVIRFRKNSAFPVLLEVNTRRHGPALNYQKALQRCTGSVISLCDQDDIWNNNKLELSVTALQGLAGYKPGMPGLVHTGVRLLLENGFECDSPGRYRDGTPPAMDSLLKRLALQNTVTGCTAVFTAALRDLALPFPPGVIMHDWWLALNAAAYGQVGYINQATVLYRRHPGTVTSAYNMKNVSRIRAEYRGMLSLLKCMYGHEGFNREIIQVEEFLSIADPENPRIRALRQEFQTIGQQGFMKAWHYVRENDVYFTDKYSGLKAVISLLRHCSRVLSGEARR